MKNWISIVLCFIMTISYIRPVVAIEMNDEDSTYNKYIAGRVFR